MSNATFQEKVKAEDVLEHYGVVGMKWGVHNEETQRKYGEIKSPGRKKSTASDNSKSPAKPDSAQARTDQKTIASRVKEKYAQHKEIKARQQAEIEAKQKAVEDAARKKTAEDREIMTKFGVTREQYEAMRQATLNSNDPRVVIQGMKYLTDEELDAKITRLEKEGKVKSMAVQQRKEAAGAAKAEREARQQTIPYRLGQIAVQSAKSQFLDPTLREASKQVGGILAKQGQKALDGLKKDKSIENAKKETKQAAEKVKDESAKTKLAAEAARIEKDRKNLDAEKAKAAAVSADRERQIQIETGKAFVEAINAELAKRDKKE